MLEKQAKEIIKKTHDLSDINNKIFFDNPDNPMSHEFFWHQWGIITHTKMFLKYYREKKDEFLSKIGIKELVDEYLKEKIKDKTKAELLELSIVFHDIGKFEKRKISYKEDGSFSYSFKGHEESSYEILKTDIFVNWFKKELGMSEDQIEYVAQCCKKHFELGKARGLGKKSEFGFTFKFLESKDFHDYLEKIYLENKSFALEVGLLFMADTWAKTEVHIDAESDECLERQHEKIVKLVKENNWKEEWVFLIKRFPVNIKLAEIYLKKFFGIGKDF